MSEVVFIDAEREGYTPSQVYDTVTVGELIAVFRHIAEDYGSNLKVYLRHDNGYTYGGIHGNIEIEECDDIEDEEEDEDWEDEDDD